MNSPLGNSIRSFWTPENTTDPEALRLIRHDKVAVLALFGALLGALAGTTACIIGIVNAW